MEGFIFGLFAVLAIGLVIWGIYQSAKRRNELTAWARSKGLRFSPRKDWSINEQFPQFKALQNGSNRYAYNIIKGELSGREVMAFDYHYETHSSSSKGGSRTQHHHFSAVILRSDVLLKPLFIRPEGFFDKVTEFFGFDDIDFESAEFSRKFYVRAKDKRWAYDVIHARTMQFLLDMPRFTIQFGPVHAIASRSSRFKIADFEAAIEVVRGMLDRFPEYLVKQLKGEG